MTVERYHHPDWDRMIPALAEAFLTGGDVPDDLKEGFEFEEAPTYDHFAVRDIIAEFFGVSDERLASIRAGDEDGSAHFMLALAAYRAGKADCDCRDD